MRSRASRGSRNNLFRSYPEGTTAYEYNEPDQDHLDIKFRIFVAIDGTRRIIGVSAIFWTRVKGLGAGWDTPSEEFGKRMWREVIGEEPVFAPAPEEANLWAPAPQRANFTGRGARGSWFFAESPSLGLHTHKIMLLPR